MATGRQQRRGRPGTASTSIVRFDNERARKFVVHNKRVYLAIEALLQGLTPSQFCTMLAEYAKEIGDDHPSWFIHVNTARNILDRGREELAKDVARDRKKAYATMLARYERLYRRAVQAQDDRFALMVLGEITELQERVIGEADGRKAGQANLRSDKIGQAVAELTEAITRHRKRSRKAEEAASQGTDTPDVS